MKRLFVTLSLLFALLLLPPSLRAFSFTSPPTRIVIPSSGISLPVYTARIVFETWEVRTDGASFGESSSLPGTQGNTIIFSHALPWLFGNLTTLKKGDIVHVFTDEDWFVYEVTETLTVDPTEVEVLSWVREHEVTLYTCVGENYSQRFIVKTRPVFELDQASKP